MAGVTGVARQPPEPVAPWAIVSCITDNFIALGGTFLASLLAADPGAADCDILLLTCPRYAPLGEANRALLRRIHPGIRFWEADTGFLSEETVRRWHAGKVVKAGIDAALPGKRSVFLKLLLLVLERHEAAMWLDSDLLVRRPLTGLFRLPARLAMVPAGRPVLDFGVDYGSRGLPFNSGLMVLKRPYLSAAWFGRAVALLEERRHTELQDQSLLNALWAREPKLRLPHLYNWKVRGGDPPAAHALALRHACAVHFVGEAKWELLRPSASPLHVAFHAAREAAGVPLHLEP